VRISAPYLGLDLENARTTFKRFAQKPGAFDHFPSLTHNSNLSLHSSKHQPFLHVLLYPEQSSQHTRPNCLAWCNVASAGNVIAVLLGILPSGGQNKAALQVPAPQFPVMGDLTKKNITQRLPPSLKHHDFLPESLHRASRSSAHSHFRSQCGPTHAQSHHAPHPRLLAPQLAP
jgi:hypothetical protein